MRACKIHLAPRTIAAKKFGFRCWALALARLQRTFARRAWRRRKTCLSCRCAQTFGATRPVLPVLGLAFLSTVGGPPISLAFPSSPPAASFGTALGATVSGLGMCGVKRPFATLEQTMSLPRLTCPLTGTSLVASLTWAQGSCELPAAKPRTRRSLPPLRGAFLDHDSPRCRLPIQPTPIKTRFQARLGTTWLQPTDNSLGTHYAGIVVPEPLLLTGVSRSIVGSKPWTTPTAMVAHGPSAP